MMKALGFRKRQFLIGNEPHIHYFNRHFGFVLRPARTKSVMIPMHGLHHLCLASRWSRMFWKQPASSAKRA